MVEWFLALKFLKPKRNYVSLITILSLLGVIFGVMVLVVVLSVMEGFERELKEKIIGFNPHITITNHSVFYDYQDLEEKLRKNPDVSNVSPFVIGPVLVNTQGKMSTPYIKGVVTSEKLDSRIILDGEGIISRDAVIVGAQWAAQNKVSIGDKIVIYSPRNLHSVLQKKKGEKVDESQFLPDEYTVTGIFYTGFYEFDSNFVLMDIIEAQRLYGLQGGIHGLAVTLKEPLNVDKVKKEVEKLIDPPVKALTWIEQNQRLFSAIAIERRVMTFVLFFVMIVAAFGLSSTLITITVQKSKEISVLRALGAKDRQVLSVFTLYGFIIGTLGAFLGACSGLIILFFRNPFSHWLNSQFGIEVFPSEIYQLSSIPAHIETPTVLFIVLAAIVLSTLAALLPALQATRLNPVAFLRN